MTRAGGSRSGAGVAISWELRRWQRSRRVYLLAVPLVAGPVGSLVADLYLRVGSRGAATVLGLIIVAALAGLILLDLAALALGEELEKGSLANWSLLPIGRPALYLSRLVTGVGIPLVSFLGGAGLVVLAADLVPAGTPSPALSIGPFPAVLGLAAALFLLGTIAFIAPLWSGSASGALSVGVIGGFALVTLLAYLWLEHTLSWGVVAALVVAGTVAAGVGYRRFFRSEGVG